MNKPKIIFFARYPVEFEEIPFPGFRKVLDKLVKRYEVHYLSMKWKKPENLKLREGLIIENIPQTIDITSSYDKWFKTLLYYLYIPFIIYNIKKINPSVIICKETFPFIPLIIGSLGIPIVIEVGDWWPSIFLNK